MKICAVICEYNPFHSGHLYQLGKMRSHSDKILCVMSGNFVQRAEPAIIGKYDRAAIALSSGADIVVENPVTFATQNGEKFAEGAIRVLENFPDVTHLAMGCETDEVSYIHDIAEVQLNESEDFKAILSEHLSCGLGYATAYTKATVLEMAKKKYKPEIIEDILSKPNNLLCIEYIKSIARLGLNITPLLIKRKGNDYNSSSVYGDYLSASAIRDMLTKGDLTSPTPYLPNSDKIYNIIRQGKAANYNLYDAISVYNLRIVETDDLGSTYDAKEGIEFKLKENASKFATLTEILNQSKSKRYTYARLKRIVLQNNLGITKDLMEKILHKEIPTRLLAIKHDFKSYLSEIGEKMIIRTSDYDRFGDLNDFFAVEKRASLLYSLITNSHDGFYTDRFVTDEL